MTVEYQWSVMVPVHSNGMWPDDRFAMRRPLKGHVLDLWWLANNSGASRHLHSVLNSFLLTTRACIDNAANSRTYMRRYISWDDNLESLWSKGMEFLRHTTQNVVKGTCKVLLQWQSSCGGHKVHMDAPKFHMWLTLMALKGVKPHCGFLFLNKD